MLFRRNPPGLGLIQRPDLVCCPLVGGSAFRREKHLSTQVRNRLTLLFLALWKGPCPKDPVPGHDERITLY
jgi:hypothetical protein